MALLGISLLACQPEVSDTEYVAVELGEFESAIEVVGEIEAQEQVFLAPYYSSKLEKIKEDGSVIKKNEVVAELESKDVEDDLNDKELEYEVAKNDLAEHQKNTKADHIKWQASVQEAQKVLTQKELALKLTLQGAKAEALEKIALTRDLSKKAFEEAQADLSQKEALLKRGLASQLEVLEARLNQARKNRDYQLALAEYKITQDGATPLDKKIARLEVQKAQNNLAIQRHQQGAEAKKAALKTQKLQAKLKSVGKKVDQLKEQLKRSTMRAPLGGTVVISKIWTNKGLSRVKVGDDLRKGQPFMSIADLNEVVVRTEVGEQYIRQLKPGQPCLIQVPSLEKNYPGKIQHIGVLAKERAGRDDTTGLNKVFEVAVVPTEKTGGFKPGTSVDVKIPMVVKKQVMVLSRELLHKRDNENYVILNTGEERVVKIGEANPKQVVIVSGLQVGDLVQKPSAHEAL